MVTKRIRHLALATAILALCATATAQTRPSGGDEEATPAPRGMSERVVSQIQEFLATAARSGRYDLEPMEELLEEWERLRAFTAKGITTPAEGAAQAHAFVRGALLELEPDYAAAVAALEQGKEGAEEAKALFEDILDQDSPYSFLEAYCRLGVGQSLLALGRTNEARLVLAKVVDQQAAHLPHTPEALFDLAHCLNAIALRSAAADTYRRIVDDYAQDAPPELLAEATEKAPRDEATSENNPMKPVVDLMGKSEGRLSEENTASGTQRIQKEIVDLLDELIKKAEEAEKGGGSAGGAKASGPASSASLPGGDGKPKNLRRVNDAKEEDAWGNLPERERERVMQTLKERFPARYKELLEQYYKSIQSDEADGDEDR